MEGLGGGEQIGRGKGLLWMGDAEVGDVRVGAEVLEVVQSFRG